MMDGVSAGAAMAVSAGEDLRPEPAGKVTRPVLRWHGGKWTHAAWIIAHFGAHRIYVEPFGGAGSVLTRKPPAYADVYNDLDATVVGFFRVLRDPGQAAELLRLIELTPFARTEFNAAYEPSDDPIISALRLAIRSFMGFGSDGATGTYRTGFRANSNRSGTTPAHDWRNYPVALRAAIERWRGVTIECRPAVKTMAAHDGPLTLHYVDPPYLHGTRRRTNRRAGGGQYRHEMTDQQHAELLAFLPTLEGMVVLSGYPDPRYDDALPGWRRVAKAAMADGARKRTEVLWLNPAAADACPQGKLL